MGFLKSMNISASGMTAQRMRMDLIAENVANATTTRTAAGQTYRRKVAVLEQIGESSFSSYLNKSMDKPLGNGVRVKEVEEDEAPFKLVYDPTHPDANEAGYVQLPNVDTAKEMIDMIAASRAYEANITTFNAFKNIAMKALEIGK